VYRRARERDRKAGRFPAYKLVRNLPSVSVRMDGTKNHHRPHVHISVGKQKHVASLAIDNGELLAGRLKPYELTSDGHRSPGHHVEADHSPKSCSVAAQPDGSACRDSLEPVSSPCSAMYRSSSWIGVVFGRRTMSRATVWWVGRSQGNGLRDSGYPACERIAQRRRWLRWTLESRACACSTPRRRSRSASLRASAARSAAARIDAPVNRLA